MSQKEIKVAIARGIHLFPFRTEKLSLVTPMVLRNSGRVGSRRLRERRSSFERVDSFLILYLSVFLYIFGTSYRDGGETGTRLVSTTRYIEERL